MTEHMEGLDQLRSETLKNSAKAAGEVILKANPTEGIVEKEGWANITTEADKASERVIVKVIHTNFPNDSILSEETLSDIQDPLAVDRLWVIDPIDGTSNFRNQKNYSSVSIAYAEKGVVRMGAAYNPFTDELFYAEQGKGAFLNGRKITVGNAADLSTINFILTDISYEPNKTRRNAELLFRLNPIPRVQMKGSAVLAMSEVAAGRFDLFYILDTLEPWDNAAAHLIAREAGAVVKDFEGRDIDFTSKTVIVGNPTLVTQFIAQVNPPQTQ